MPNVEIYQGDCLEIMPTLPQVDAIITDLPYGTTRCSWDEIIPFEPMWKEVKRILKPRGVFVTTASQPFTSKLVMSNLDWFKYEWIWDRVSNGHPLNAKIQPLRAHENILVFCENQYIYNPQKTFVGVEHAKKTLSKIGLHGKNSKELTGHFVSLTRDKYNIEDLSWQHPRTIIKINSKSNECNSRVRKHPTQKPVALLEYLIRTYTNEGDTVLDICAGSGTTGVACINTGRNAILIEKESKYIEIIERRIAEAQQQPSLLEEVVNG